MRHFVLMWLVPFLCASVFVVAKGTFEPPHSLTGQPSGHFPSERLSSFRGGINYGDEKPDRARRPQPDYDNFAFAAPNYFSHELVYMEDSLVLDWQPSTGEYALFKLVRQPANMCPIVPETPIARGVWPNRKFHKLIYIGCLGLPPGGKVLDYDPNEGSYDIVRFNHQPEQGEDPMMEVLSSGFRREIMNFQPLYVNEDEILFYEKQTGKFSIYYLNNQLPSLMDPIQPSEPIDFGKVQGLHEQLIYLGKNTIMDYDPTFGRFWLYTYDRTVVNNTNPFLGPIASGTIEQGMVPTFIAENQILLLEPSSGMVAAFNMSRVQALKKFEDRAIPDEDKEHARFAAARTDVEKSFDLKVGGTNFGFASLLRGNQCTEHSSCKDCLKSAGCGWCATSKKCLRGSTQEPCATNCTNWLPLFCEGNSCAVHRGCSTCLSDPFCGWCADEQSCVEGTAAGPLFGGCADWSKVLCPHLRVESVMESITPCVDEGLIS
eukprot:c38960_g1_i1.p1 GENE.c38960_g1_i1~~c38960_g1_i1.p1  ORF type:complete len:489 (-),score=74.28 c38960_g1_i1:138-1604(-)